MRILILVPSLEFTGGVANHYLGLRPYFNKDVIYCCYGRRKKHSALICLIPDIIHFFWILCTNHIDVVIINPSFRKYQLFRDGFYLLISKIFHKKVVTFFHGWDYDLSKNLLKEHSNLFLNVYNKSSFIYVLCSDFKKILLKLGISVPILFTSTKVENSLLSSFNIDKAVSRPLKRILFLARAEKSKGLHIVIEAFAKINTKYHNMELYVCGEGGYLNEAKKYVNNNKIQNVKFWGNVSGEEKIKCFSESDIYVLPSEQEGMATSVLEAMAFGLPIVTTPVGGTKDFFEDYRMGILLNSYDVKECESALEYLILHEDETNKMKYYNHKYATSHFLASNVAKSIENDVNKFC